MASVLGPMLLCAGLAMATAESPSFFAEGGAYPLGYEERIVDEVLKRSNQAPGEIDYGLWLSLGLFESLGSCLIIRNHSLHLSLTSSRDA